ncbi:GTPBP10 [Cordylochernes scorpioides]|uniref:GTPBP10 n=1 Tax=Cordylochernes scorpioides TaxID=51811 RepID=A0ABY6K3S5_9ARAC|nr:GTPBP10 [Cordylochernes scorpioides]
MRNSFPGQGDKNQWDEGNMSVQGWKSKFVDSRLINVKGGPGGQGLPSSNWAGGNRGNVVCVCKKNMTLEKMMAANTSHQFMGKKGKDSKKYDLVGSKGPYLKVPVPPGITAVSQSGATLGEETYSILLVLGPTQSFLSWDLHNLVLRPTQSCPGTVLYLNKLLFPNAGKSSLLKALTRAKPKIDNQPFTTLNPNLGVIEYRDQRNILVADLPGLVEGAHHNVGLGNKFLKHVIGTKLLVFVVDVLGFQLHPTVPHRTALENVLLLNQELEKYQKNLLYKPAILLVNKMDFDEEEKLKTFKKLVKKWEYINVPSSTEGGPHGLSISPSFSAFLY